MGERRAAKLQYGSTDSHAEQPCSVMLELEILVGERFGAVDTGTPGTIAIQKIPTLDHEVFDLRWTF